MHIAAMHNNKDDHYKEDFNEDDHKEVKNDTFSHNHSLKIWLALKPYVLEKLVNNFYE